MLRAAWSEVPPEGLQVHWASRGKDADIQWDLLAGRAPILPEGAVILHLAGVTTGSEAELRRNSAMIEPLVMAAHSAASPRVLFASTAAVYGRYDRPAVETDETRPLAPYGAAKLEAERLLMAQSQVPAFVLRIGNVIGADALMGPQNVNKEVILDPISGRDGGPIRSWIGPRQLAALLARLALIPLPRIMNVAVDPPHPMADLLNAAGRSWRYGPQRQGVLDYAVLDTMHLQGLVSLQDTTATMLAQEAAWALGILR